MSTIGQEDRLIERIYWLIKLRWIAITGVVLTVLFAKQVLRVSLNSLSLYSIAAFLAIYNLIFILYLKRLERDKLSQLIVIANRIANVQISLDLLSLTMLIHFSGGIENPFIFYFIFHMIIASILLSRRASFLQATFAVFLFMLMIWLEYTGFLRHYSLKGFVLDGLHTDKIYIFGVSLVFISTLYLAAYMAGSISIRLREREKSLKEANDLLEEKDRIKSEYVLRVTHDVKEHISAIQSCIVAVAEGITGELNPRQRDLIKRADERACKLILFIKALLEITRIKLSRYIEMKEFSLTKTIKNAVMLVDVKAKAKGLSIESHVEANIVIKGTQIHIEETIVNLLSNSVKYTLKSGKIGISAKDEGDSVLIQISDTGIGIPKDEASKVFDEFYRARNAREIERDGTGLGLSMAKEVVERHNGKIWVESEEGKGSTFSIVLPK